MSFRLAPRWPSVLGNAETVGRQGDLFETVSKKWRIYRREGQTRHDLIDYPSTAHQPVEPRQTDDPSLVEPSNASVTETARRVLCVSARVWTPIGARVTILTSIKSKL
ncbi:hypothetical protein Nham_3989 [Nitrobacter hamburgensis X14]|uniref:Uncharacterized protein n=1 Tax=Nitrobacter hamburgensis (strain DSM 10229 / NCIMB 13809 / X14) TaxID=323097 RepID=Q1QGI6_NITHX|nr:hypothetical protein Nham_3989 [Nitrobacter hamburgensis X14]